MKQTCKDPEVGRRLEDYHGGNLDAAARASFENHVFRCPCCLHELELRQILHELLGARQPRAKRRNRSRIHDTRRRS